MLTHEDVVTLVSKRLNIPREQVHIVMLDFWHNLRSALTNPDLVYKTGIRIRKCFKVTYNPTKILRELKSFAHKTPCADRYFKLLTINNYLLENEIYSKKQSEVAKIYQRPRLEIERIKGDCADERKLRRLNRSSDHTEEE